MSFEGIEAQRCADCSRDILREGGIDDAAFDAGQLTAFVLGKKRFGPSERLRRLTAAQAAKLEECLRRRLAHEPLQYIIGEWEFMGLPFEVGPGVLIPRPDTETLCEAAEALIRGRCCRRLLDICTGTGCIGIALAKRCGVEAVLSDISPLCTELARRNAELNGVSCTVVESDVFEGVEGKFDMITANPPYIESGGLRSLQPEVRFEPALALDGGADGLNIYRRIRDGFRDRLTQGGTLLLEIGFGMGAAVRELFSEAAPDAKIGTLRDIEGRERVITVQT